MVVITIKFQGWIAAVVVPVWPVISLSPQSTTQMLSEIWFSKMSDNSVLDIQGPTHLAQTILFLVITSMVSPVS